MPDVRAIVGAWIVQIMLASSAVMSATTTHPALQPTSHPCRDAPLPRICVRDGRFVEKDSGRPFLPRGFNYIRLIEVNRVEFPRQWHGTFAPDHYDADRAEAMFADLRQHGFNIVRVFIDPGCGEGIADTKDSVELSPAYMGNFIDFLQRGRRHGVYVIPALFWIPLSRGYLGQVGEVPKDIQGPNRYYLHRGYIEAKARYVADFARTIQKLRPDLCTTLFAYELDNETHLFADHPPFSLTKGICTPACGKTYDLASEQDLQAMADENVVLWADTCFDAVHAVDPDALVGTSVFTFAVVHRTGPGKLRTDKSPDQRFPARPLALARTKLSYLDIHFYPYNDQTLARDLESIEFDPFKKACDAKGIPMMMGEFGAVQFAYKTVEEAAVGMKTHALRALDLGFIGYLYWTYDCHEQDQLWNAKAGDGQIFKMLAALNRRVNTNETQQK